MHPLDLRRKVRALEAALGGRGDEPGLPSGNDGTMTGMSVRELREQGGAGVAQALADRAPSDPSRRVQYFIDPEDRRIKVRRPEGNGPRT